MKDSFYFQHDYSARNDDKLLELRGKYGNEGYAVFWYCLETMAERGDGYIIGGLLGGLSLGYGVAIGWLQEYLDFCVEIDLFKRDEKGYFSPRMIDHLNTRETFKVSGKLGAEKRWANRGAIRGANAKERKVKESKGKKSLSKDLSLDKEDKLRFENLKLEKKYKPLKDESMTPHDDRDHSFPRKRTWGEEPIDWILDYSEHLLGRELTGQERWNRIYTRHLIRKYGATKSRKLIEWLARPENWWYDKISQMSTIYKKADQFFKEMEKPIPSKSKIINLDEI